MDTWRKWVDIRVKVGKSPAAQTGFLLEIAGQSLVEAQIVSFMFCLSDLVKRHLPCVSWPKDISICHFQIKDRLPGSVLVACPFQHFVEHILFLFRVASLQPAVSQRLNTFHLDLHAVSLPIRCQVFLSSFNISTNSRMRNNTNNAGCAGHSFIFFLSL